jgi:uncharacterized membrane protein HdeD (DUF308 family)
MRLIKQIQVTSSNWWLLALEAVVAMIVGIAIMAWPKITLAVFIYLFGAFVVVDGLIAIGYAFARRKELEIWWVILVGGFIAIILGILVFVYPKATGLLLLYMVAAWALLVGIVAIANAFSSGLSTIQKWATVVFGILSLLLSGYLFFRPGSGILALTWLVGAFLVVYGLLLLIRVMFPGKAASPSSQVSDVVESQQ